MGIGDSITFVACFAGMMFFSLPALMLVLGLTFDRTTDYAAHRLNQGAITPLFLGLIPVLLIGIPSTIFLSLGSVFQLCGSIAYLLLFMWGFLSLSAVGRTLGMKLMALNGESARPLYELLLGTLVLTLAIAFPIWGWFVVFPAAFVIGIGATVLVSFKRLRGDYRSAAVQYQD
jgi:hypothetical protein